MQFTNPKGERATHLVISRGLLLKERKLIPTAWVTEVSEDEVHLTVGGIILAQQIARLSAFLVHFHVTDLDFCLAPSPHPRGRLGGINAG